MTEKTEGMPKSINYFRKMYDEASDYQQQFELIKEGVEHATGRRRSGLMLGLMDLGVPANGFIGAFHQVGSNAIIMNRTPLRMIEATKPELLKPYVFHVLMHEYLHALGFLSERSTRLLTYRISLKLFGEDHPATSMSTDFDGLFPGIVFPLPGFRPPRSTPIEIIPDFEPASYIG